MVTTVRHSNTVAFPVEKTNSRRARTLSADNHTSLRLHLSSVLQTSLELTQVLSLFFEETKRYLHLGSLSYQHNLLPDTINYGRAGRHSAHYRLITSQDALGEVSFTRRKPFSEDELTLLEMLIGCLICPLRNALLYREAIQTALKDSLTGVGNRLALENTLEREVAIAHRHQHDLSVLVVDVDHFKTINDRFGHAAGDCVLKNVAAELIRCSRDSDAAFHSYRFGGEEFVILLNHTDSSGAKVAAERIRASIGEMTTVVDHETIKVSISIGIATLASGDSVGTLFKRADEALYSAKREGRNRVVSARSTVQKTSDTINS